MKKYFPYAISVDWLQCYCLATTPLIQVFNRAKLPQSIFFSADADTLQARGYRAESRGYGSKVFREVWNLIELESGEQFCTIAFDPYSNVIDPTSAILKVENKALYEKDLITRLTKAIEACGMAFQSLSRLDVCYDCNFLLNGRSPQNLMDEFDRGRIRRAGSRQYIAFKTQSAFIKNKTTIEEKSPLYYGNELKGDFETPNRVNSLTWGFRGRSSLQAQIYNKTAEIKQGQVQKQGYKSYIEQHWRDCGLDTDKNVYRFECRITADSKELQDTTTGKNFKLSLDSLHTQKSIEEVFAIYANKAFSFFENNGASRTDRMPRIELFCIKEKPTAKTKHFPKGDSQTRTIKILLNYLKRRCDDIDSWTCPAEELRKKALYILTAKCFAHDLTDSELDDLEKLMATIAPHDKQEERRTIEAQILREDLTHQIADIARHHDALDTSANAIYDEIALRNNRRTAKRNNLSQILRQENERGAYEADTNFF